MNEKPDPDWDPRSDDVLRDQRAAYDEMRRNCPVAYSDFSQWSVFRHADVTRIIHDPITFSNAVSQHLSVPNGMDPPEHTVYREIIDAYFSPERMNTFEPVCREIAINLLQARGEVELMTAVAVPFAVRGQCAFLGWTLDLEKPLADWTKRNYQATLAQDRQALSDIARELEEFIDEMLEERRQKGAGPEADITASLMHEKVWGRPLSNEEIASITRIWTVGEIGSIASSIGILVQYLAKHTDLQHQLRAEPSLLPVAIDEILRIHGPLVASRRITTCPVTIGERSIGAGERISLNWVSVNRDAEVFEEPDTFRLDRNPDDNLLYGAGIHVCPGAPLARMEMRVFMEEILQRTTQIQLAANESPIKAVYPASGFATLPINFQ